MPNLNIIKLITLKVFEILTPKADIRQKLSFYYRPKFNLGTEWNQEKYWSSLQDSFFTGSSQNRGEKEDLESEFMKKSDSQSS